MKELSGIARRWQTYLGRGVYVALIGAVVWVFWSSMSARGLLMSPSAMAELAHAFFITFLTLQLLVTTLGGVSAGSDMVTRELRGGTLGLLALTPMTSWRIAAGKWKASVIQTTSGLVCGLPVFAILIYLGGMGFWEFAYSFALSISCAFLGSAIGLFWSTVFKAGYVATIVSIITILAYCIAPAFLLIDGGEEVFTFLTWVHPFFAAIGAVYQGTMGGRIAAKAIGWIPTTGIVLFQVWVLLRWTASRLRTLVRESGSGATASTPAVAAASVPRTSGFARSLRGGRGVWERNAILWKELSTRRLGTGTAAKCGLLILVFFLLTALVDYRGAWRVMMFWFSWLILLLVALASGVSLFVTEREERKWDVLLSTPLRSFQIVAAKLLAGLAGLSPMTLTLAAYWGIVELFCGLSFRSTFMSLTSLILVALLAYVLGAVASLHARSQRAAFSTSFGLMLALLFVFPVLLVLFQSFANSSQGRTWSEFVIGSLNPAPYMAHASEALVERNRWEGRGEYLARREGELQPMFGVYVGVYAALIGGGVGWMISRFDRSSGRS